uniref:substrate-binding domain-containing protein n=1 Tax=Patulibacter defluvii TaxID=3095358 RepID=UPI002A75A29B
AAVVHGPRGRLGRAPAGSARFHLARWRVGLAVAGGERSLEQALAARRPLVRRAPGASSQDALDRAAVALGRTLPDGPVANDHASAALLAEATGGSAVTYEPAAVARGLRFLPLEEHAVELWVAGEHRGHPAIVALLDGLGSRAFRERVASRPGYDLQDCGAARAA